MTVWLSETPMTPEQAGEMLECFFKNCVRDGFVRGFKKHFSGSKYILDRYFNTPQSITEYTPLTDFLGTPLPSPLRIAVFYGTLQTRSGVILTGNPTSAGYIMGEDRATLARIETKKNYYFFFRDAASELLFYVGEVAIEKKSAE